MNKRMTMAYAVAAGVAATLLLAGCNGGDEDPPTTPTPTSSSATPSSSATVSPSASPTATTSVQVPSAARAQTDAGAVAFARFYVLEVDKAYVTQDSSAITAYATTDCANCRKAAATVDVVRQNDERQTKPSFTLTGAQTQPFPNRTVVDVYVDVAAVPRVARDGSVVTPGAAEKTSFRVDLDWIEGWKVKAVGPR